MNAKLACVALYSVLDTAIQAIFLMHLLHIVVSCSVGILECQDMYNCGIHVDDSIKLGFFVPV